MMLFSENSKRIRCKAFLIQEDFAKGAGVSFVAANLGESKG